MRALLDINVLIAILDKDHLHHFAAHRWLADTVGLGWASCPLTENGVVRIMSSPVYSKRAKIEIAELARRLRVFIGDTDHQFWPDDISLLSGERFDLAMISSSQRITDSYLLALAVSKGGRLVTFDQNISLSAVSGAKREHLVVLPISSTVSAP